jgi:nucleotide-binding universal stress UspA family protein
MITKPLLTRALRTSANIMKTKTLDRLNSKTSQSLPKMVPGQEATTERVNLAQEGHPGDLQCVAFRSILVPLDGSAHAEHALPYALAIARRSGATVHLVHVQSREDYNRPWWKRAKQKYLSDVADRIARTDAVPVEASLIESDYTEDSLLRVSANADLLVMASRRRGFFRRLWAPSVADALRTRVMIPALFVRGDSSPVDLSGDPIARHILVPLDGSASSERILGPATAIGRLSGAMLTLLNVQINERTSGTLEHTTPSEYLEEIARNVRRFAPVVGSRVVTTDRTIAAALASYAEVDLIALTAHSTGGLIDLLRRCIVDSLMRRTNLPILLLRGVGCTQSIKPGSCAKSGSNHSRCAAGTTTTKNTASVSIEASGTPYSTGNVAKVIRPVPWRATQVRNANARNLKRNENQESAMATRRAAKQLRTW